MYIRRTHTSNSATGERYTTHRLVQSERLGGRVRQVTLLNLGRHFALPPEAWPAMQLSDKHLADPARGPTVKVEENT